MSTATMKTFWASAFRLPRVVAGTTMPRLAAAVRRLQHALLEKIAELDAERAVLSSVVSGMREGLLLVGPDHRIRVTNQSLRQIPLTEHVVKETLRLHPPLILLPRTAMQEFRYGDHVIAAGTLVAAAPAVSHRDASCFPSPERFEPERFAPGREEDWIEKLYSQACDTIRGICKVR